VIPTSVIATPTSAAAVRVAPTPVTGPRRGGTLRVVAQASVFSIDPAFSGAYVTNDIAQHIFDQPFAWDANLNAQPQMVGKWEVSSDSTAWTLTLREGLTFHDGAAVTTDDLLPSLVRWFGNSGHGRLLKEFLQGGEAGMVKDDASTITMKFKQPYGAVAENLAFVFRMPATYKKSAAAISPNEDVGEKNLIGTGPYKLARWERGNRIVLERHEGYKPRSEPGSYLAGGKNAYLDRIEWLEIPNEETKIAGLRTREFDVVDGAGLDFFDDLKKHPDMLVAQYWGHKSSITFHTGVPPTNNVKVRQAILAAVDVDEFMSALGPKDIWMHCPAIYYCNTPLESDEAKELYDQANKEKARQLLKEAGYAGETIILMNPTDYATIAPIGQVLKPMLEDIGMKVDMPGMDWATLVSKIRTDGYNIFTTWFAHWATGDPISDIWAAGARPFGGNWNSPKMKEARLKYALTSNPQEKLKYVAELQRAFYDEVPFIILGQFSNIFPHWKHVKNFSVPALPIYINVWVEK
jgi:peptide/nickel transport system substrate-binding protein